MSQRLLELLFTLLPTLALGALVGRMSLRGKLSELDAAKRQKENEVDELLAQKRVEERLSGLSDADLIRQAASRTAGTKDSQSKP